MNCPFCGKEMEQGFVQSARRVLYTAQKNEGPFSIKAKGDIVLTANNWVNPTCVAYHCRSCKRVVIDYSETMQ